jgi:hypothetical protein
MFILRRWFSMKIKNITEMLKRRMSFKIVLLIAACVLIASISLDGTTFAWFYDSTVVLAEGGVQTASFGVKVDVEPELYEFKLLSAGRDLGAVRRYVDFEDSLSHNSKSAWGERLKEFMNEGAVVKSGLAQKDIDNDKITRSNLIIKKYTYENTSDSPVYIRMPLPVDNGDGVQAAYYLSDSVDGSRVVSDGMFLYWLDPIWGNEKVEAELTVYIPHALNESNPYLDNLYYSDGLVGAKIDYVEVIQATNNAVYFVDGWKDLAMEGKFESPYNDAGGETGNNAESETGNNAESETGIGKGSVETEEN